MSPSKRLRPVQRVAESKEQKAARYMGLSRKTLQAEEIKLNQLKQYHQEYLQKYDDAGNWLQKAAALPDLPPWELESTAKQLAAIFRLHSGELLPEEEIEKIYLDFGWLDSASSQAESLKVRPHEAQYKGRSESVQSYAWENRPYPGPQKSNRSGPWWSTTLD